MSTATKTSTFEESPSCVASNAASRGSLMPDGFVVEGSILPQSIEDFANAISYTANTIGSIPSTIFSIPKQLRSEKVDSGYVCSPEKPASPAKPRLRSCRSVLNRQQALRNCCIAQAEVLDFAEILACLHLQIILTLFWAWTALKNDLMLLIMRASPRRDVDVPMVALKGEVILGFRGETDASTWPSLRRVQSLIDRGQAAVSTWESGVRKETEDEDLKLLFVPEGVVYHSRPRDQEAVKDRLVFSADFSWLVTSISWEFAAFYLWVVSARLGLLLMAASGSSL